MFACNLQVGLMSGLAGKRFILEVVFGQDVFRRDMKPLLKDYFYQSIRIQTLLRYRFIHLNLAFEICMAGIGKRFYRHKKRGLSSHL